jgi:hypothetical protein
MSDEQVLALSKQIAVFVAELKDRDEIIKELHRVNSLLKARLHEYESAQINTDEID